MVSNYNGQVICGTNVPENYGTELARWGKRLLVVGVATKPNGEPHLLPGLSLDQMNAALTEACKQISAVCNLKFRLASPGEQPDIAITTGVIDGRNGTLAWSELARGTAFSGHLTQKYDSGDQWGVFLNPPAGFLDLLRVMLHELLHALGVPHIGSGNLMAPTYSLKIRGLQAGDIAELIGRYGPAVETPTDPPTTPTGDFLYLTVGGERWRIPAERVA